MKDIVSKFHSLTKGMAFINIQSIFKDNSVFHHFKIRLVFLKFLSFAVNITNQLCFLYLTLIKLLLI